ATGSTSAAWTSAAARRTTATLLIIRCVQYAQQVLRAEVLLVDVVGQADDRDAARSVEDVDGSSGHVTLRRAVATVDPAELPVLHAGASNDVDRLFSFPVAETRKPRLIAFPVVYLNLFDDFSREVTQRRHRIVAEKLLTVYEHPADLLSVRLHGAVLDHYAGHLGDKVLGRGV